MRLGDTSLGSVRGLVVKRFRSLIPAGISVETMNDGLLPRQAAIAIQRVAQPPAFGDGFVRMSDTCDFEGRGDVSAAIPAFALEGRLSAAP